MRKYVPDYPVVSIAVSVSARASRGCADAGQHRHARAALKRRTAAARCSTKTPTPHAPATPATHTGRPARFRANEKRSAASTRYVCSATLLPLSPPRVVEPCGGPRRARPAARCTMCGGPSALGVCAEPPRLIPAIRRTARDPVRREAMQRKKNSGGSARFERFRCYHLRRC